MKVICISGKAEHGKDTLAGMMKEVLEQKGERVLITHYGDLVKYVAKTFFNWDGLKNEEGRTLLQYIGTDKVRQKNVNFWVEFIAEILDIFSDRWDVVLIPDCRFANEIDVLLNNGFSVTSVRINRENHVSALTPDQLSHASETSVDDIIADYIVTNTTLEELYESAVLLSENILQDM